MKLRTVESTRALREKSDPATLVFQCGATPAETTSTSTVDLALSKRRAETVVYEMRYCDSLPIPAAHDASLDAYRARMKHVPSSVSIYHPNNVAAYSNAIAALYRNA